MILPLGILALCQMAVVIDILILISLLGLVSLLATHILQRCRTLSQSLTCRIVLNVTSKMILFPLILAINVTFPKIY